jgi:hypothetical protein
MENRLESFRNAFTNEAVLREALQELFTRLPNIKAVQVTHGSDEYGKDLVFVGTGPLGEPLVSACIVKNCAISGDVDSIRSAGAVLNQVRQALTTSVLAADGSAQRICRVYVISPSPITQTALQSIKGQIDEHFGQVVFICGHDFLALFKTYYPEFLLKSKFLTGHKTAKKIMWLLHANPSGLASSELKKELYTGQDVDGTLMQKELIFLQDLEAICCVYQGDVRRFQLTDVGRKALRGEA